MYAMNAWKLIWDEYDVYLTQQGHESLIYTEEESEFTRNTKH